MQVGRASSSAVGSTCCIDFRVRCSDQVRPSGHGGSRGPRSDYRNSVLMQRVDQSCLWFCTTLPGSRRLTSQRLLEAEPRQILGFVDAEVGGLLLQDQSVGAAHPDHQ